MNQEQYFLLIEGETSGPFTLEQLQELWLQQGIPLDTLYACPGLKECLPVDLLLEKIIGFRKYQPEPMAPPKAPPATGKWITTFSTLVALSAVFVWSISPFIARRTKPADVVSAGVETSAVRVTLTNNDNQDWPERIVSLNDAPPAGYQCRIRGVQSGATVNLSLIEFINADGARFQPWSMTVKEVWIGGGGKEFKRFRIVPN